MPNLCENKVAICGDKTKLDRLEQAIKQQAQDEAFDNAPSDFLNTILPVPEYLRNAENLDPFIVNERVDWKVNNWGTIYTCDVDCNRPDDHTLNLSFRSAWSPPIYTYQILVKEWDLKVKALFFEPLCCYAGTYENGVYRRFNSITSGDVHELPKELRDAFGIESYLSVREGEPETVKPTKVVINFSKDKSKETIKEERKKEFIRRALRVLEYECRPRVVSFDWLYKIDVENEKIPDENSANFRRDVLAELGQIRNKRDLEKVAFQIDKYKPTDEDAIEVIREFRRQENPVLIVGIQKRMRDFIRHLQSEQPNIKELEVYRALQSLIDDYDTYTQYLSPLAMNQLKMANYIKYVVDDDNFEPLPPDGWIWEEGYPFCGDLYDSGYS